MKFLEAVGRWVLRLFEELGRFFSMLGRIILWAPRPPYDIAELLRQMVRIGVNSIPVVFLTTLFTGMVLALQSYHAFAKFNATGLVGSVVALSLMQELSPVLCSLMVTGRVGSSMAAEIGSMRITEQIDALEALATEPVQYLFVPRVLASIVVLPLLVVLGDVVGMVGGYFVSVQLLGSNATAYYAELVPVRRAERFHVRHHQGGGVRPDLLGRCLRARLLHDGRRGGGWAIDDAGGRRREPFDSPDRFLSHEAPVLKAAETSRPPDSAAVPALRVEDLHKSFGALRVLDGIDLTVATGESLVIVGPSGTGKSVLLKHFIGLIRPDSGKVFIDGQDLWALDALERNAVRKKFGMAFQEGALFDSMSVFENIAFPLRRSGRSAAQVKARVEECLALVRLPNIGDRRPWGGFSGGMRRRVGFARAIAHEPRILLFDEPNTGLDPITTDVIAEVILSYPPAARGDDRHDYPPYGQRPQDRRHACVAFGRAYPVPGGARRLSEVRGPRRASIRRRASRGPADRGIRKGGRPAEFGGRMSPTAKVGAFFLVALVLIGLMIWKIKDFRFGKTSQKTLSVQFDDVAGLKNKADVRLAGVLVGRVAKIRLVGGKALVDLELTTDVELRKGASATIQSLGMLGDKYVELVPGPVGAVPLPEGTTVQGEVPVDFDEITKLARDIEVDMRDITKNLKDSLGGALGHERLTGIVDGVLALTTELRKLLESNRANIDSTTENFREFSAQMGHLVSRIDRLVASNQGNVTETVTGAKDLSGKLQTTVDNMNAITGRIKSGGAPSGSWSRATRPTRT